MNELVEERFERSEVLQKLQEEEANGNGSEVRRVQDNQNAWVEKMMKRKGKPPKITESDRFIPPYEENIISIVEDIREGSRSMFDHVVFRINRLKIKLKVLEVIIGKDSIIILQNPSKDEEVDYEFPKLGEADDEAFYIEYRNTSYKVLALGDKTNPLSLPARISVFLILDD